MRFFLGLILGAALTIGGAYLVDNMNSGPGARPMVNWDVVAKTIDGVARSPETVEEDRGLTAANSRFRFAFASNTLGTRSRFPNTSAATISRLLRLVQCRRQSRVRRGRSLAGDAPTPARRPGCQTP
jgi:hypothetical protein